ncbi:MAG TPA: cytochrome c oxidase subunit II [Pirellulales bacterium]|nr:cytochrome c oxidase subunit II [Pirellulales bacterium]
MSRYWSILFLLVPILGVALFVWAAGGGMWLPRDISEHGHEIDHLWNFILILTGVVFVATEVVLFWFLWKYDASVNHEPVKFMHGSHNLEVIWTILPASTLLFIAIYQMNAWADVKMRKPDMPATVEVMARQFEWRLRYPGSDGKFDTPDDIHYVNDLHIPVDEEILVDLKSMDVLHDFFLPNMRIKQDAVPGMVIPVWFRATDQGQFDLVCAELCGWGHYKMKGRLTVESRSDFDAWLKKITEEQNTVK